MRARQTFAIAEALGVAALVAALTLVAFTLLGLLGGCSAPPRLLSGDTVSGGWYARASLAKF